MTEDHGVGRSWSPQGYWGWGDGREAEQDHLRKLAAGQRERAACMRREAAALRARNRLVRTSWPSASDSGTQPVNGTIEENQRSPAGSSD
jgi:hypothetical protein